MQASISRYVTGPTTTEADVRAFQAATADARTSPRLGFDRTCKFDEMIEARRSGDPIGEHPRWRNDQNQPAPLLPKYRVSDLNKRP
jgi:hypothetical protein